MADDDRMPTFGAHRGVALHAFQSPARLKVVKASIDQAFGLTAPDALVAFAADPMNPPEARLLAAARIEALWRMTTESREIRPKVSLSRLAAIVAGLDSLRWASPVHYGTDLQTRLPADPPLPARDIRSAAQLRAAQARAA